jgi:hypothetical protein
MYGGFINSAESLDSVLGSENEFYDYIKENAKK